MPQRIAASAGSLEGQRVGVVGLGASGRAAARLALRRGAAKVVGFDARADGAVPPLAGPVGRVETVLGPQTHRPDGAEGFAAFGCDALVLSPGMDPAGAAVRAAAAAGAAVYSELGFAAELLPAGLPVAAVTGTNGKSTVTTFLGQLLAAAGRRVFVGGNLGEPLSTAVADPAGLAALDAVVLEVSSYQLQVPNGFRPRVGAVLNLAPDHLERHGTLAAYGRCKCNLFRRMGSEDLAVLPADDPQLLAWAREAFAAGGAGPRVAFLGGAPGVEVDGDRAALRTHGAAAGAAAELELDLSALDAPGQHNRENAAVAALLAWELGLGLTAEELQGAVGALRPLPHRMECVGRHGGVLWVNDSKATNLAAAAVGIANVEAPAVVLLGGRAKKERGSDALGFAQLAGPLARHRHAVAFGEDGPQIRRELEGCGVGCSLEGTLAEAAAAAAELAQPGDAVLLSPACASFDEFANFEERGRAFAALGAAIAARAKR